MNTYILKLLDNVRNGSLSPQEAYKKLQGTPYEDLGYAKVDHQRQLRTGIPEVIYGASKTADQIIGILAAMQSRGSINVMVTRISPETAAQLKEEFPITYYEQARLAIAFPHDVERKGNIVVVTAGTSDIPVSEEAAHTAEILGNHVTRLYDVGVAGIHRLLDNVEVLQSARVIIVIAGMEGALASVVGGLVRCPVIAVPTSVGYGASFHGLSALLSMLNSCANGVSVVNIDNGFGAGVIASKINQMEGINE